MDDELTLTRCGIDSKDGVAEGRFGDIHFRKSHSYYWIVNGKIPLAVANKLYADPVGVTDIRVDGHCGCVAPEDPWLQWTDKEGVRLIKQSQYDSIQEVLADSSLPSTVRFYEKWLSNSRVWEDTPPEEREAFVTLYHIDSELGLYIFANTLKSEGLV